MSAPSPRQMHPHPLNMLSFDENIDERENENKNINDNEIENDSLNNIDNNSNISIMNSLVNFDTSCWLDSKMKDYEVPTFKNKDSTKKSMKSIGSSLHRRSSAEPVGSKKVVGRKYLNKSLDNRQVEAILKPVIVAMSNMGVDAESDIGLNNVNCPIERDESDNGIVDQGLAEKYGLSTDLGPGATRGQQGLSQGLVKRPNQIVVVKNAYKLNESFDDSVLNSMYDDGVNQDSSDTPQNYRERYNYSKDDVEGELEMDG